MSSILLYGPPGGGKSTLAATMCELGYRGIWIDADRKIRTMHNLKQYVESGQIEVRDIQSPLLDASLRDRMMGGTKSKISRQPKGYLEVVDAINDLTENPPNDHENCFIVLDSLTRILEHMKRMVLFIQGKNHLEFAEWGFILSNLEELFVSFYGLQPDIYKHAIIIAHAMTEKDEVIGKIKTLPLIDGSMRNKAGSYVEEMYYCYVETDRQGQPDFKVLTKPMNTIDQARSSRDIPTFVEADFRAIFEDEYETGKKVKK